MTAPASRRGFLSGLTALPLIGGSVALIGAPSAVAAPVTSGMLATYSAWLWYERRALMTSCGFEYGRDFVPCMNPGSSYHFPRDFSMDRFGLGAQQRAPVVLAAVGCPATEPCAEEQWANTFRPMAREGGR